MHRRGGVSVSVVIPAYNAGKTIARALSSVVDDLCIQEIIVSDDGSDDDTKAVVARFSREILIIAHPNSGAPHARNRGLEIATGQYVLFLDADDYVDCGYVDALACTTGGSAHVVIGPFRRIDVAGHVRHEMSYKPGLSQADLVSRYLFDPVQTGAFLWRRDWLMEHGGWDESLSIFQDAELALRMLLKMPSSIVAETNGKFAYWVDNDSTARLSNEFSAHKAESSLRALEQHRPAIVALGQEHEHGLALRYYGLARRAFAAHQNDVGSRALKIARELSLSGHPGSLGHKIGSRLLGLRMKEKLSIQLKQLRDSLRS
jgi:glycosyltransferase involved in cell wall biosynthesis